MPPHPLTAHALTAVAREGKIVKHKDGVYLADIAAFWPIAERAGGVVLVAFRAVVLSF